ncbi:hypothetical protein BOO91_19425 [Vibrio navarrensis]|uniref:Uncharacterized protein n=1 Tax=Vibrio navarrensis TaxID=29495 RepID=A0AAJ4IAC9_9VIBR|nr:hypothetical protein [Vibrio navarrensis]MBE3654575.1 hypothetical protein [Vibrio navarrensis]MBE3663097.1 hypothetical protein [Vibrio navarrensis]QPL52924.1 hypothetical protein I3X05_13080 [Vibrio navarrensis]
MFFKKSKILTGLMLASFGASASPWSNYYGVSVPSYFPSQTEQMVDISSRKVVRQAMLLNAADLNKAFKQYPNRGRYIFIADTLLLDEVVAENIQGKHIFILARVIKGDGLIGFSQLEDANTSVTIVADQIESGILITSSTGNITRVEDKDDSFKFTYINLLGKETVTYDSESIEGIVAQLNEDRDYIFNQAYDYGASIYDTQPKLSIDMLNWYANILASSDSLVNEESQWNFDDIFRSLKSLSLFYSSSQKAQNFVPVLDLNLYSNSYSQILDAMEAFQSEYDQFENHQNDIQARKESARLMLDKLDHALSAQQGIIENLERQITYFQNGIESRIKSFKEQEDIVETAKQNFRQGIIDYQRKFIAGIAIEVFSSLADLGSSVISAFAIGPAAIETTAKAVGDAAQGAQQAVSISKRLEQLSKDINKTKDLSNSLDKVLKLIKNNQLTAELHGLMNDLGVDIPDLGSSSTSWELARIDIDTTLGAAQELGVLGTREYKNELNKLMTWGSSASGLQVNLVVAMYRLTELQLAKEAIEKDYASVAQYIDDLDNDEQALKEVEQYLFRAYNLFKHPLYSALLNYNAAYKYHTFKESTVTPRVNSSYLEYNQNLVSMDQQLTNAIEGFYENPPQSFVIDMELDDQAALNRLRETGEFSFIIDEQNHKTFGGGIFNNKERVRLDSVGVELYGSELEDGKYEFQITHNGEFRDFYQNNPYIFNTKESHRIYSYFKNGEEYKVITAGEISEDFGRFIFKPTPFSTWTVKLFEYDKIDLSNVENIKIYFSGDWVTPEF